MKRKIKRLLFQNSTILKTLIIVKVSTFRTEAEKNVMNHREIVREVVHLEVVQVHHARTENHMDTKIVTGILKINIVKVT
jgi:hypothetical protein